MVSTTDSLGPSLLFLVAMLLVVVVVLNPDVAVMAVVAVAAVVSMFFCNHLMLPWTCWWTTYPLNCVLTCQFFPSFPYSRPLG